MADGGATALADEIVGICTRTLPPLAGAILHGSLATGAFVPGRSDVDVLAIVDEQPSDDELSALGAAVEGLRGHAPVPLDLCVVTTGTAAVPSPAPRVEIYVRLDPGDERRLEVEMGRPRRDLVVEFSVCRAQGRSLAGPMPADLIGPVPDDWVMEVGAEVLDTWQAQEHDPDMAPFMVFTTCRIWRFAEERVHCPKPDAVRWALDRDPSLTAAERTLTGREPTEGEVRDLMTRVRRMI